MPRAAALLHHLDHAAVLKHEVVGGDFAARRAQTIERDGRIDHAGIVDEDHIGAHAVLAFAVVRRRPDVGNDRSFCCESTA